MIDKITYAKAGGPPNNWYGLEIIDLATGSKIKDVIEVNTDEGWLLRYKSDEAGNVIIDYAKGEIEVEKLTGSFEIRRQAA